MHFIHFVPAVANAIVELEGFYPPFLCNLSFKRPPLLFALTRPRPCTSSLDDHHDPPYHRCHPNPRRKCSTRNTRAPYQERWSQRSSPYAVKSDSDELSTRFTPPLFLPLMVAGVPEAIPVALRSLAKTCSRHHQTASVREQCKGPRKERVKGASDSFARRLSVVPLLWHGRFNALNGLSMGITWLHECE